MTAMQAVEVAGLVRRVDRHPGKARLLEIENAGAGELLDEGHTLIEPPRAVVAACDRPLAD